MRAVEASFAAPCRRDPDEAEFLRRRGTPEDLIGLSADDLDRRAFAAPRRSGVFRGIDLSLLDPGDPDDRRFLIEAEHPEFADVLEHEVVASDDGEEVNPGLHLTIHEIVVGQLWENDPPEAWQTARRLLEAGYERHEILHMLGSALVPQLWRALREGKPADPDEYVHALAALPGDWAAERAVKSKKSARRVGKRKRRKR